MALAFGAVIAVMIAALGPTSGAHFNPAVSVGLATGRHFAWRRIPAYALVQVAGAITGALILRATLGPAADLGVTKPAGSSLQALVWEGILTFVLVLVITAVSTGRRVPGVAAAFAIGTTVALGSLVGGPISGASMNPARSIGPALVSGDLGDLWIYVVGPLVGAVAAASTSAWIRRD